MRHREDSPPSAASRRHCFYHVRARLLSKGVLSGRIFGGPSTLCRDHVWAATRLADQGWGRILFFVVVVNNSEESSTLRARVLEARSMSPICKTKVIRCQRKGMTVYKNASWVKSFFTLGAGRPNL